MSNLYPEALQLLSSFSDLSQQDHLYNTLHNTLFPKNTTTCLFSSSYEETHRIIVRLLDAKNPYLYPLKRPSKHPFPLQLTAKFIYLCSRLSFHNCPS